jgi:hypothetical protein
MAQNIIAGFDLTDSASRPNAYKVIYIDCIDSGSTGFPPAIILVPWIAALLIIVQHAENIQRLFQGHELK